MVHDYWARIGRKTCELLGLSNDFSQLQKIVVIVGVIVVVIELIEDTKNDKKIINFRHLQDFRFLSW